MSLKKSSSIQVIAGVNGAGKSSLLGGLILQAGGAYYNPDEAALEFIASDLSLTQKEANSLAWKKGVELLRRAIQERLDFTFETTLGGNTIARLLGEAAAKGIEIHAWYAGLSSPELHIARVRSRVERGGHDIPEEDIRRRYKQSRRNLIGLLPHLTSLRVFDNSFEANLDEGKTPKPVRVLHVENGTIIYAVDSSATPKWAKPIIAAAIKFTQT